MMMSAVSGGLMLVSLFFAVSLLLLMVQHRRNKKKKRLLRKLSYLGSAYNLVFTSQQAWNNRAMGLDGVQRKLLFLHCNKDGNWNTDLIQLDDVKTCSVEVEDNKNKGGMQEKKLFLRFRLLKGNQVKNIPFYEAADDAGLFFSLQKKAKDWQGVLSKMLRVEQV